MIRTLIPTLKTLALTALLVPAFAFAEGKNYEVVVKKGEMHCADCADKVKEALSKLPDVAPGTVKVELKKNTAYLTLKEGQKVADAALKVEITKALKDAGYTVEDVKTAKQ